MAKFYDDVTFAGNVTFSETPAEISLDNLTDLTGAGFFQAADLIATDDLTVGDNAAIAGLCTIGETLAVTGATTLAALACTTLAASGAVTCATTLGVTGATTAAAVACTTLAASGAVTCATTLGVTGASTFAAVACTTLAPSGTLAAAGAVTVGTTLAVTGTSTMAAVNSTALAATTSLTVTGATVVGLHEHVTLDIASLVGTTVYGLPSPVAGTITKIQTRLKGALTTGDATLTAKIGASAVTNGVVTITQSGSAAGDIDVANPTAANTVSVGSNVNLTVGGTNDAAVGATVVITFLRSA